MEILSPQKPLKGKASLIKLLVCVRHVSGSGETFSIERAS